MAKQLLRGGAGSSQRGQGGFRWGVGQALSALLQTILLKNEVPILQSGLR